MFRWCPWVILSDFKRTQASRRRLATIDSPSRAPLQWHYLRSILYGTARNGRLMSVVLTTCCVMFFIFWTSVVYAIIVHCRLDLNAMRTLCVYVHMCRRPFVYILVRNSSLYCRVSPLYCTRPVTSALLCYSETNWRCSWASIVTRPNCTVTPPQ